MIEKIESHPHSPWWLLWVDEFLYTPDNIARIQDAFRGKKVIVFDFDGVCHDESLYSPESQKIVPYDWVIASIRSLKQDGYTLVLWTTRTEWFTGVHTGDILIEQFLKEHGIYDCFDLVITGNNTGIVNAGYSNTLISTTTLLVRNTLEKNRSDIDTTEKNLDLLFPQWAVLIDNNATFSYGKWRLGEHGKYQIIITGNCINTYFNPDPESPNFTQNTKYLWDFSNPTEEAIRKAITERFKLMPDLK